MVETFVASLVDFSRRHAGALIAAFLVLVALSGYYVVQHFSINTDVTRLLDENVEWRQREIAFSKAFPQRDDLILIVIDGKNSIDTELAAHDLASALEKKTEFFRTVSRPDASSYFQKHGLLLLSTDELADISDGLIKAQPMLATLSADPSPRGLFSMISLMLDGVQAKQVKTEDLTPLFQRVIRSLQGALAAPADEKTWNYLFASQNPGKFELRRFILAQPVLDYSALSPGEKATDYIHAVIRSQQMGDKYQTSFRLTGPVPLADEEFASVSQGMEFAMLISLAIIYGILYFTLKTWRIILPVFITLLFGLTITTALALLMVKSLNLISVAFAVMFTGIAVDFGIQFGVRYRDVRVTIPDLAKALEHAAKIIAVPLLLAALSTALGFLSFVPTSYRGVAELGLIAGVGMIIAFTLNITLLPALIRITKPGPETEHLGFSWTASLDRLLLERRKLVLGFFTVILLTTGTLSFFVRFDFDPLNLKNPKSESVATIFDLTKDPDTSPYTIDILAPNLADADAIATKLNALPEVASARTLSAMVPDNQEEKQGYLKEALALLSPSLNPEQVAPAPTVADIKASAAALAEKIRNGHMTGEELTVLVETLEELGKADDESIEKLIAAMAQTVKQYLTGIKGQLDGTAVTINDIPDDLRGVWVTAEGMARIEVFPKGNANDHNTLVDFVKAVREIAPEATGSPVSIQESATTIKRAFIEAAVYSTGMIFIVLLVMLKDLRYTLFVLITMLIGFALTLGTATLAGLSINFANIIALPLLLGLGVSYAIYFVVYWVQGRENPLQSSMARAVLSSAATSVVAFGSLSVSNHPGTASMGLLLTLSLFYVLFTTFFFLPTLLGKPIKSRTK
jgi:hopanoid biosynthesis associated RND transporter like protein HpnN